MSAEEKYGAMKERLQIGFERRTEDLREKKEKAEEKNLSMEKEIRELKDLVRKAEAKLEKFEDLEMLGVKELMKLSTQKEKALLEARKMKSKKSHARNTLRSVRGGVQSNDGYTDGWGERDRDVIHREFMQRNIYDPGLSHASAVAVNHSSQGNRKRAPLFEAAGIEKKKPKHKRTHPVESAASAYQDGGESEGESTGLSEEFN